jgi:hypothetical protein
MQPHHKLILALLATFTLAMLVFAGLYFATVNSDSAVPLTPVSTLAQLPAITAVSHTATPRPAARTATPVRTGAPSRTATRAPGVAPTNRASETPTVPSADTPVPVVPADTAALPPPTDTPVLAVATATSALPSDTPPPPSATATAVPPTGTATVSTPAIPATLASGPVYPYISNITVHALQIYQVGQQLGRRINAFALVGDSNTANPRFLAPFEYGNYTLGDYTGLQTSIDFFHGYFDRQCPWPCSPAAKGSFNTSMELSLEQNLAPGFGDARCAGYETPLACEYRLQQPSIALILIGTGDHLDWRNFEGRYRQIVEYTVAQGIIPVLLTKADELEYTEQGAPFDYINNIIRRLAVEYDVPLLDLRKAVAQLPDHGCVSDGFHYNSPPDGRTADFSGNHLNYGFNMRNLTALEALDELRVDVIQP